MLISGLLKGKHTKTTNILYTTYGIGTLPNPWIHGIWHPAFCFPKQSRYWVRWMWEATIGGPRGGRSWLNRCVACGFQVAWDKRMCSILCQSVPLFLSWDKDICFFLIPPGARQLCLHSCIKLLFFQKDNSIWEANEYCRCVLGTPLWNKNCILAASHFDE